MFLLFILYEWWRIYKLLPHDCMKVILLLLLLFSWNCSFILLWYEFTVLMNHMFFAVLPRQNFQIKSYKIGSLFSITCTHWKKTRCIEPWLTEFLQLYNRYVLMILKYWKIKFDIEWQLKYLLNNKLAKYSKNNKDKNDPKNMGYYSIIKNFRTE